MAPATGQTRTYQWLRDTPPTAVLRAFLLLAFAGASSFSCCVALASSAALAQEHEVRIPFLALGDANFDGRVTAADALLVLRGAVGSTWPSPVFDVDGSATAAGGSVTASDALLTLRKALGSPLPVTVLDAQEFRREMTRWILLHQNVLGLVEFDTGEVELAATYDQGVVGLALLAQYDVLDRGLVEETVFTKAVLLDAVRRILDFYRARYRAVVDGDAFIGFAEFYGPMTGLPDYSIGAGGNLAGPSAYVAGLIAQYTAITGDASYLEMAIAIADWLASLERSDGGLRFGTIGSTSEQFQFVSTEHNLSSREAIIAMATVLASRGSSETSQRLHDQADRITHFLETVVWDSAAKVFVAGIDALGALDRRLFTDLFALAAMSQLPLPQGIDRSIFLTGADASLRGSHAFDLNPSVEIDGFGSFDNSGVQNEWSAMMSLAHVVADAANVAAGEPKQGSWRWSYFFRQVAKARIDEASDRGSGLAQAAKSHPSGFGGFGWGSQTVAPASIAWWILSTLDFPPFVIQQNANTGVRLR